MTLYLPYNLPGSQIVSNYIFSHNKTHSGLVIDYGSLLNHHESPNTKTAEMFGSGPNIHFQVRRGFQCVNRNVLKISMHAHIHYVHINTFKASKDIAAGQEIFVSYGTTDWFKCKKIPYANVDYASTMWRPDLHPLPCRQAVRHTTGADGRPSFTAVEAIPPGTVLEISLCLEVSVVVVDELPYLRDFVLTGETENE